MSWFQEIFPSWKDKMLVVILIVLVLILSAIALTTSKTDATFSSSESKATIQHWTTTNADCYVLVDDSSKRPITMSCVARKPE